MKQKVQDSILIASYEKHQSVWKVAEDVGLCGQSVHERLVKLGVQNPVNLFTENDKFFLLEHYNNYLLAGKLQELADKMGRTKQFICRKAKGLGLTDISRPSSLLANYKPNKPDWSKRQHPRGFAGWKHSDAAKAIISEKSIAAHKRLEEEGRLPDKTKKMIDTKMVRGNLISPRQKQTWKAGWREIGGKRKYFRSKWEANYARYLQFLKDHKQIVEWEHEAKVFWFEGIKRGCVSFLPDFQITELSGSQSYHEVKGWMDERSKTKIRRMSIYFPDVALKIIDAIFFKQNNKILMKIIEGWET